MTQTTYCSPVASPVCFGGRPIGTSGESTPSIVAIAIRIASLGLTLCSSHHKERGPAKTPGLKVIRSGVFLVMESVSSLGDLANKIMDAFNRSHVPIVKVGNLVSVIRGWQVLRPLQNVLKCCLNLGNPRGVFRNVFFTFDRHLCSPNSPVLCRSNACHPFRWWHANKCRTLMQARFTK
jgi:hypothetical protein